MFANVLREVDAVPMKSLTREREGGPQCTVGVGDGGALLGGLGSVQRAQKALYHSGPTSAHELN
jgi:hypothetical protein